MRMNPQSIFRMSRPGVGPTHATLFVTVLLPLFMVFGSGQVAVRPSPVHHSEQVYQHVLHGQRLGQGSLISTLVSCGHIAAVRAYALWNQARQRLPWLLGICALPIAILTYFLRTQVKRITAGRKTASYSTFQEVLAVIAAELVAGPGFQETGSIRRWLEPFQNYFGFDWAVLFEQLGDEVRTVPLDSNAAQAVTRDQLTTGIDETNAGSSEITVLGAGFDEIMGHFPALQYLLCQNGSHSFVILPLRVQDRLLGALVCASVRQQLKRPGKWKDELQILENIFAASLERSSIERALRSSEELKASILSSFTSSVAV